MFGWGRDAWKWKKLKFIKSNDFLHERINSKKQLQTAKPVRLNLFICAIATSSNRTNACFVFFVCFFFYFCLRRHNKWHIESFGTNIKMKQNRKCTFDFHLYSIHSIYTFIALCCSTARAASRRMKKSGKKTLPNMNLRSKIGMSQIQKIPF